MYHPPDLGTNDNTRDEYVELFNPTDATITLQDTNGAWRLDGGVAYTFAPATTIPAGGTLLVVNFSPSDTATLTAFRAAHGITNTTLPIVGPYSGKLRNRGDRVALERPQYPDVVGEGFSWVIVDEVIYGNQHPWPTNANGFGAALHRASIAQSGNDPANWVAAPATPGDTSLDRDGDGMPDAWEDAHSLDADDPADAALDADDDGLTNLQEYWTGTDPQDASSRLGFDSVSADGPTVTLAFTAVQDRTYSVQFRDALPGVQWQTLTNVPASTATRAITVLHELSPDLPSRFYRLVSPSVP
jgi:hypothetical protein